MRHTAAAYLLGRVIEPVEAQDFVVASDARQQDHKAHSLHPQEGLPLHNEREHPHQQSAARAGVKKPRSQKAAPDSPHGVQHSAVRCAHALRHGHACHATRQARRTSQAPSAAAGSAPKKLKKAMEKT